VAVVAGWPHTCSMSIDRPEVYAAMPLPAPLRTSGRYYSLVSPRVAILDTNYILNKVQERVRLGPAGWLLARFPGLKTHCFASLHVLRELYAPDNYGCRHKWDKLAEQSVKQGWATPAGTFQRVFEQDFLGQIRFVDVGTMFESEPLPHAVRTRAHGQGAPDAPTAQLAVLLSRTRPVVYAHDEDLYKPGVAPRPKVLAAVEAIHGDVEDGHATLDVGSLAVHSAGYGAYGLAVGAERLLGIPKWLTYLGLITAIGWLFTSPERRRAVGGAVTPIMEQVAMSLARASEGLAILEGAACPVPPNEALECRIAEILAFEHTGADGLLAKDIQSALSASLPDASVPSVSTIRATIAEAPCFEESRWRYQLGQTASPFRS
jgi:hypothetical protein